MYERAQALIEEFIRPLVHADGGKIELLEAKDQRVVIRLSGACNGCPGKPYTMAGVVEPLLRSALGPDIQIEMRAGD